MKKINLTLVIILIITTASAQNVGVSTMVPRAPFNVAENKTMVPVLLQAIKEQQQQMEDLKKLVMASQK